MADLLALKGNGVSESEADLSQYPMNFHYTGGCSTGAPGKCGAADQCPGAFVGTDTASGTPVNCVGDNAGVSDLV